MNDEMNMNDIHDEVTDEVTLDVADEPQIIDLTEPDDILADVDAAPVTNPWRRPGQWFVVHTQAGYEKKVKANLEARIQSLNIEDRIYETVIPMEDVVEFKNGRKQTVQKKVFPGYILVRCIMDDESWYWSEPKGPKAHTFVPQRSRDLLVSEG
jgi:transcriptional antiterminator NusG